MILIRSKNIEKWRIVFIIMLSVNMLMALLSINTWYCFLFCIYAIFNTYLINFCNRVKRLQEFEFTDMIIDWKGVKNKTPYILLTDTKDKEHKISIITKDDMNYDMNKLYESQEYRLGIKQEMVLTKEEASKLLKEEGYHEI